MKDEKLHHILDRFLSDDKIRNMWIEGKYAKVYVRKSMRPLFMFGIGDIVGKMKFAKCLDIGGIEIDESMRGKGIFNEFLDHAKQVLPVGMDYIHIENVLNTNLAARLERNGWKRIDYGDPEVPSFFMVRGKYFGSVF